MSIPAQTSVEMRDFGGMAENVDARDLPPGTAQVQVNLTALKNSELVTRGGYRPVTFEAEA